MDANQEKRVQYTCDNCNQTRNLLVNSIVHMRRKELKVNGLAPYVDIHPDKSGRHHHGVILMLDKNFHVRSFSIMEKVKNNSSNSTKQQSIISIPAPTIKHDQDVIQDRSWISWNKLEMILTGYKYEVHLLDQNLTSGGLQRNFEITSRLETVSCKITTNVSDNTLHRANTLKTWISEFCNILESVSSLYKKIVPLVFSYIDFYSYREITDIDIEFLKVILDNSAIYYPKSQLLSKLKKYHGSMHFNGIDLEILENIINEIIPLNEFSFNQILPNLNSYFSKQKHNLLVIYLYQIFHLNSLDYHTSYIQTV